MTNDRTDTTTIGVSRKQTIRGGEAYVLKRSDCSDRKNNAVNDYVRNAEMFATMPRMQVVRAAFLLVEEVKRLRKLCPSSTSPKST
jgi:hypothetical protein